LLLFQIFWRWEGVPPPGFPGLPFRWGSAAVGRPGQSVGTNPPRDRLAAQRLERGFPGRQRERVIAANEREFPRGRDNGTGIDPGNAPLILRGNIVGAEFAREVGPQPLQFELAQD